MKGVLGIELGSTRIKACLVEATDPTAVIATGSFAWENRLENDLWMWYATAQHPRNTLWHTY